MTSLSNEQTAFPTVNDLQMGVIAEIGQRVEFKPDEELIAHGQKDYPFFVIESGQVRILERDLQGDREVAKHGPRPSTRHPKASKRW